MMIPSRTPIDALLNGGLQTGLVTHVYGPAGSGKTTFALHASVCAAELGYGILYLDVEHAFPVNRLVQVLGGVRNDNLLSRIRIIRPASFQEQRDLFSELKESGGKPWGVSDLALVVIDTIGSSYRLETARRPQGVVFRELIEGQMPALLRAAKKFGIAVLVLNQVTSNLSSAEDMRPVGGDAITRYARYQVRLEIEETESCTRWATIEKTPKRIEVGKKVRFALTSNGIAQTAMLA
jgi:DNA repair protein RadB